MTRIPELHEHLDMSKAELASAIQDAVIALDAAHAQHRDRIRVFQQHGSWEAECSWCGGSWDVLVSDGKVSLHARHS